MRMFLLLKYMGLHYGIAMTDSDPAAPSASH